MFCIAAALTVAGGNLRAQQENAGASNVFKRYSGFVTKVQVVEGVAGAKASLGSGFFTTPAGHVVTNYHVIANLVNRPERYRAELVDADGSTKAVTVIAIDVIHDLAILETGLRDRPHFTLAPVEPKQGQRLFSLGNPKDLGMSIVEGTYNGLLQHTLYPHVHLTASLNPGMSGGPTIDEQGRVIGVNVSTEGNQVSFLVPVESAAALLHRALSDSAAATRPTLAVVASQLRQHQETYVRDVFGPSAKTMDFGPFRVVTQPAPFFRCWGDIRRDENQPYERTRHRCDTQDEVYLGSEQTTGSLSIDHELVTTKTLNAMRFSALYTNLFSRDDSPSGDEELVTSWKCVTRNVRNDSARMRAVLCLRRYRKLGELYDASLKVAVLGRSDVGLISTLNATGLTYNNVTKLSDAFLKRVAWR